MGEEDGEVELERQDGIRVRQQLGPSPRLLWPRLRLSSRPMVYRFPAIPSRESRDKKEQKRAVEARLSDGEAEGMEGGAERLGNGEGEKPEEFIM